MKSRWALRCAAHAALAQFLLIGAAAAAGPVLAPALPGAHAPGTGVDATFLKVADDWHGSTVPWNEATQRYGSGQPIGSFGWGTGLWGIADWSAAQSTPGMVQQAWHGRVAQIAWGDARYNAEWAATWGAVPIVPLFGAGGAESQDNWSSRFGGYIRIAQPGAYNFAVQYDDGFFFRLTGAGGHTLELVSDYLSPRDRLGFAEDLLLDEGLYAFELGAYDRIEAGVVELSWSRGGDGWTRVPTENLVDQPVAAAVTTAVAVPEPAAAALALVGLAAAAWARRRRTRAGP